MYFSGLIVLAVKQVCDVLKMFDFDIFSGYMFKLWWCCCYPLSVVLRFFFNFLLMTGLVTMLHEHFASIFFVVFADNGSHRLPNDKPEHFSAFTGVDATDCCVLT